MAADVYTVPLLPRQVVEALEKDREFRRLECIVMWLEVQQRELLEDHQDEITGVRTRTIHIPFPLIEVSLSNSPPVVSSHLCPYRTPLHLH